MVNFHSQLRRVQNQLADTALSKSVRAAPGAKGQKAQCQCGGHCPMILGEKVKKESLEKKRSALSFLCFLANWGVLATVPHEDLPATCYGGLCTLKP